MLMMNLNDFLMALSLPLFYLSLALSFMGIYFFSEANYHEFLQMQFHRFFGVFRTLRNHSTIQHQQNVQV